MIIRLKNEVQKRFDRLFEALEGSDLEDSITAKESAHLAFNDVLAALYVLEDTYLD